MNVRKRFGRWFCGIFDHDYRDEYALLWCRRCGDTVRRLFPPIIGRATEDSSGGETIVSFYLTSSDTYKAPFHLVGDINKGEFLSLTGDGSVTRHGPLPFPEGMDPRDSRRGKTL